MPHLLIAMAMLCKESALMLLPALVLFDRIVLGLPWRILPRRHAPGLIVAAGWLAVTYGWLARSVGGAVRPLREQLLTQAKAAAYYAYTVAVPTHLNVEPQFVVSASLDPAVSLAGLCVASAAVVAWQCAGNSGKFLMGMAALWALPTTVMPLNVLVNERRLYMLVAVACVGIGLTWRKVR